MELINSFSFKEEIIMLFNNPRRLLSEAAAADMLNPEVSDEVKDVVEDLEDVLTNNVEVVDDEDKTTNGGIPITSDSVAMMEAAGSYDSGIRYLISLESVIAVMEAEGEEAAKEAMEEPGTAPSAEEAEANEPDPVNVVEDIAEKNGVDPDQVAVVITAENVRFLAETAILEAKAGKKGGKGKKKLKKTAEVAKALKGKIALVKA